MGHVRVVCVLWGTISWTRTLLPKFIYIVTYARCPQVASHKVDILIQLDIPQLEPRILFSPWWLCASEELFQLIWPKGSDPYRSLQIRLLFSIFRLRPKLRSFTGKKCTMRLTWKWTRALVLGHMGLVSSVCLLPGFKLAITEALWSRA